MKKTLYSLFREDQKDHKLARAGKLSREKLYAADKIRRKKSLEILKIKNRLTGSDFLYASVLFHHASNRTSLLRAKYFAEKSLELKHPKAQGMLHAIEDRLLIIAGKPQKHGTHTLRKGTVSELVGNSGPLAIYRKAW